MTALPTWITVCDTCQGADPLTFLQEGAVEKDGVKLAQHVEAHAQDNTHNIRVRRVACLMGCSHSCNISLQSEGKISYTLGKFTPTSESAAAIVEYAQKYAESHSGQVPYKQWPEGVKGHFITRHHPLPR